MTVYIFRQGKLVAKQDFPRISLRGDFPAPMLSRLEPYESPIDGREITSWGQRERDMRDNNAYDPRDVGQSGTRKRHVRPEPKSKQLELPFWTDPV